MDGDVSDGFHHWQLELLQQAVLQQHLPHCLEPEVAGDLQNALRTVATSMILDPQPLHSTCTIHPFPCLVQQVIETSLCGQTLQCHGVQLVLQNEPSSQALQPSLQLCASEDHW
jgi:hypothetical protein